MVRFVLVSVCVWIAACATRQSATSPSAMAIAQHAAPSAPEPDQPSAIEEVIENWRVEQRFREQAAFKPTLRITPPIQVDRSFELPDQMLVTFDSPAPGRTSGVASDDFVITTPYYRLVASPDNKDDATRLAQVLDAGIAQLVIDYAAASADTLLRLATVEIRIASAPNEFANVGKATNESSWNQGRCRATIHMLSPSAHPDPAGPNAPRTNSNEPQDINYCHRVLMHEYGTVLLESITRSKPSGWSFWNAPPWFVQGAEEYLGAMYSTQQAREVTLPAYRRMTFEQQLVTNDFGIDVQSPHVAGPVLVEFIHEQFGRDAFVDLLRSEAPSFGKAIRLTLNTTPDEFHAKWQTWLASEVDLSP